MDKGNFSSDPRGLIFESYNMEDISEPECRSIFLDWALGLDSKFDAMEEIKSYIKHYASVNPEHPMNNVLSEGLKTNPRRGLRRNNRLKASGKN